METRRIDITYLNGPDVERLGLTDDEVIAAVEAALDAQGRGETVIEPRVHLVPESSAKGHFNVLRGYVKPLGVAGVKVVSDFVDNYKLGLPSEMALLNLFDPQTGMPLAVIDATAITDMRTGAMTAIGAKHLARKGSRILGHVGARGTAYWNVRLLDRLFDFDEIRVHSRRPESRNAFAERLSRDLGQAGEGHGRLGVVRARRRHRRRGLAPAGAEAAAQDRMDQEGRVRRSLRHDERGRALAHRHHGQDGGRRLGTVPQGIAVRCAAPARGQRPPERAEPARGAGPDRRGREAGPRTRRRDDPVLASRPEHQRHRARALRCSRRRSARRSARRCASHSA